MVRGIGKKSSTEEEGDGIMNKMHFAFIHKNEKGFTIIELMMVFVILAILAKIALFFTLDIRMRTFDAIALSDGKNLLTIASNAFIGEEDVIFTHDPGFGPEIGTIDTNLNPRSPVFKLSPGVKAEIVHTGATVPGSGFITAFIYHESGTDDPAALNDLKKREFYFTLDEMTSSISVPKL